MKVYPKGQDTGMQFPTYDIDLDLPPRQRWVHVAKDNLQLMSELNAAYQEAVVHEFGALAPLANALSALVKLPKEYEEELKGFAEAGGISFGTLLRLNVGYDFVAKCTSAVTSINGTNYHLRNMDWSLEALRRMAIQVRFMRGGRVLHTDIHWLGFTGSYTSLCNAGGYSVSMNFRKTPGGRNLAAHILRRLARKLVPIGFVVRRALEQHDSAEAFVHELTRAKLMAPCYLTVCGGPRGGVVMALGQQCGERHRYVVTDTTQGASQPEGYGAAKASASSTPSSSSSGAGQGDTGEARSKAAAAAVPALSGGTADKGAAVVAVEGEGAAATTVVSACGFVVQTNHDPCSTLAGSKYYIKNWKKWAEGDPLLINTRDRYETAVAGVQRVVKSTPPDADVGSIIAALGAVLQTPPTNNEQTLFGVVMVPSQETLVRVI